MAVALAVAVAVAVIVVVQSKITKYKLWMIPDDTFLQVARDAEAHRSGNRDHWMNEPSSKDTLRWRQNGRDSVSNHQPGHCLLSLLFERRSRKTSKLRVTGLCVGNSPGPVNSPHKGPVTRKMLPFDDVIMVKHNKGWTVCAITRICCAYVTLLVLILVVLKLWFCRMIPCTVGHQWLWYRLCRINGSLSMTLMSHVW